MATIKKAQLGGLIKKGVKKVAEETAPKSFKIENSMVKDVIKKKEREALKEKMRGWDKEMSKKKTGGTTMKKAQTGTKVEGPTYSNLKVKNPTAKDSLRYKSAYDKVMNNQRLNFPSRVEAEGSQEALKKLKDMKSKGVDKSKSCSRIKKAANGTSLGMKSVKAGFDKNPGVTRADIITAAKGKAKSGTKMKSGGKMTKCKYGCK
jgi:hypothetical protein